jgi:hypothetical protein
MIKRIIGIIGTIVVLAVVVFTVLGRNNYSSAFVWGGCDSNVEKVVSTGNTPQTQPTQIDPSAIDSIELARGVDSQQQ